MSKMSRCNDYIPIVWDCDSPFEAVTGHVTRDMFEAVMAQEGLEGDYPTLEYLYARWIPDSTGEYDMRFHIERKSKRGNFPVTIGEYK